MLIVLADQLTIYKANTPMSWSLHLLFLSCPLLFLVFFFSHVSFFLPLSLYLRRSISLSVCPSAPLSLFLSLSLFISLTRPSYPATSQSSRASTQRPNSPLVLFQPQRSAQLSLFWSFRFSDAQSSLRFVCFSSLSQFLVVFWSRRHSTTQSFSTEASSTIKFTVLRWRWMGLSPLLSIAGL